MSEQIHKPNRERGSNADPEGTDSPFGRSTFYVLGIATAICLWAIVSFAFPIFDTNVAGLWPFPWPEGETSWGEVCMVVLTILYFWASMLQWAVSRSALRLATASLYETQRANTLTLRAWLMVEDIDPDVLQSKPLRIHTRNVGKLPAVEVSYVSHSYWFYDEVTWPLPEGEWRPRQMSYAIAPGELTYMVSDVQFPEDLVADIEAGKANYAVSVVITYTDALGTAGETRVNAIYVHETNRFSLGFYGNAIT